MCLSDTALGAGTVEVWDLERRTRVSSWPVPWRCHVAPDGTQAAYVWRNKVHLLDLRTGAVRVSSATPDDGASRWGEQLCFQPDGRRMAVEWSIGQIRLVDVESLQVLSTFKVHDNSIWALAFSPDAARLASTSSDGTVRITDVAANPPVALATLRGHRGAIWNVEFSPDASLLVSRGQDQTVRLWDVRSGSARAAFQTTSGEAGSIAFLPDGRTLIGADRDGAVHFWDVRSADTWTLRGHHSYVYPVLLSPDGATVYSGGWDGFVGKPGCLRIWDAASGDQIAATGDADTYIPTAALSPDGSLLALSLIASDFHRIDVMDTATGATIASIPELATDSPGSLAFDPDGRRLAWINGQGVLIISDSLTGATLMSRPLLEATESWPNVAWSPDGLTIAASYGDAGTLSLWDANTLEPVRQWPLGHRGVGGTLAFSNRADMG